MQPITNFVNFARRPRYIVPMADATPGQPSLLTTRLFLAEYSLFLPLALLSAGGSWLMYSLTGIGLYNEMIARPHIFPVMVIVLPLVLIMVEFMFRGILRLTARGLRYLIGILLLMIVSSIFNEIKAATNDYAMIGLLPTGIGLVWLMNKFVSRPGVYARIERFWHTRFHWVFYGLTILYAARHIRPLMTLTDWHLALIPLIMTVSFLISTYLGYIRMKYGFWYVVALHMMIMGFSLAVQMIRFA